MEVHIDMENRTHELRVQIQELKRQVINTLSSTKFLKPPTWIIS